MTQSLRRKAHCRYSSAPISRCGVLTARSGGVVQEGSVGGEREANRLPES